MASSSCASPSSESRQGFPLDAAEHASPALEGAFHVKGGKPEDIRGVSSGSSGDDAIRRPQASVTWPSLLHQLSCSTRDSRVSKDRLSSNDGDSRNSRISKDTLSVGDRDSHNSKDHWWGHLHAISRQASQWTSRTNKKPEERASLRSSVLFGLKEALGIDSNLLKNMSDKTLTALRIDNSELMRATRSPLLLHSFGQILSSSAGTADTYNMSEPVQLIDAFISHNWSTPRFGKFLVLTFVFNFNAALYLVLVVPIGVLTLGSIGKLPEPFCIYINGRYKQVGIMCQMLGIFIFLLGLFCWHEVQLLFGLRGKAAFLDKCCIHQTDEELKSKCIKSLAGFLCRTSKMVVVYSDTYLHKVWTVYELASFLAMRPGNQIVVMPRSNPKAVLCGMLTFALVKTILLLKGSQTVREYRFYDDLAHSILIFAGLALAILFAAWARTWAREQHQIKRHVDEFSIRNAKCFMEEDRTVVQTNIASFMKDLGYVLNFHDDDDALSVFDEFVREEVPDALHRSFGASGVQYRYVVIFFLCEGLSAGDLFASALQHGVWDKSLLDAIEPLILHFAIYPVVCACALRVLRQFLGLSGYIDYSFSALVGVVSVLAGLGLTMVMASMRAYAVNSYLGLWLYSCIGLFFACFAVLLYRKSTSEIRHSSRSLQTTLQMSQSFTISSRSTTPSSCKGSHSATSSLDDGKFRPSVSSYGSDSLGEVLTSDGVEIVAMDSTNFFEEIDSSTYAAEVPINEVVPDQAIEAFGDGDRLDDIVPVAGLIREIEMDVVVPDKLDMDGEEVIRTGFCSCDIIRLPLSESSCGDTCGVKPA